MSVVVTGSAGVIGSEAVEFYCGRGHQVVGVDLRTTPEQMLEQYVAPSV